METLAFEHKCGYCGEAVTVDLTVYLTSRLTREGYVTGYRARFTPARHICADSDQLGLFVERSNDGATRGAAPVVARETLEAEA